MVPVLSQKPLINPLAPNLGGRKGEMGDTPKPSAGSVLHLSYCYADDTQLFFNPLALTLPDPVMARNPYRER